MPAQMSGVKLIKKVRIAPRDLDVSEPVLGQDGVYAGHKDHDIVKVGRKRLEEEWSVPAEEYEPGWVLGNRVVCSSVLLERVRGLRSEDGKAAWSVRSPFGASLSWNGRLLVIPDLGLRLSKLQVRKLDTGRLTERIATPVMPVPALCGDVFVFPSEEGDPLDPASRCCDPVSAYSLVSRRVVWRRNLFAEMKERYGVAEERPILGMHAAGPGLFVATHGGSTFGCSLTDGRILWHNAAIPRGQPTVHEGMVVFWEFGRMLGLDERTGRVRYDVSHTGDFKLDAPYGSGAISGDHIVYGTNAGLLAVCNWRNGRLVSFYRHKEGLSRAVIADGRIFVTSYDGNMLIFEGLPT